MNSLLTGLNKEQQQAVQHTEGPLLILAGAGSGKTAAELHHGALLSVYAGDSVRTGKNVRRRRRFYGEYRPGLRRGNGCVRGGGDCGLL